MNKLIFRLVFPLTFFSYILFDKWWYVYITDGTDVYMSGFPLINCSPSITASMEWIYFITETIINMFSFFIFWYLIIYLIHRFIKPILITNLIGKISLIVFGVYLMGFIYSSFVFNTSFKISRDWEIKILNSGFIFSWQMPPKTYNLNDYLPNKNE
jgi:hypothetical protein